MSTKQVFFRILCVAGLSLLFSCSDKRDLEDYETIRMIGDENPDKALVMLDSLEIEIREKSDYARHKYDLLRIRLNDKAFNMPSSDLMIKELISREPYPAPKFWLNPDIHDFYQFTRNDVKVIDYQYGPEIGDIPVAI